MILYNVHLYREMRLTYPGIEADTPEAAASIAADKPTDEADNIEDCDGENLAALVDVAGDTEYEHSITIDFEAERHRKAAARLLAALESILPYAEGEAYGLEEHQGSAEAEIEARSAWQKVEDARTTIAAAKRGGIVAADAPPRFAFAFEPAANPDRASVVIDARLEVAMIRTDDGLIVDVYPKEWVSPIQTMTVWDSDIADAEAEIAEATPGEG